MISDALRGLYVRRDALEIKLGDAMVALSRFASSSAEAKDEEAGEIIEALTLKLQNVKTQIAVYERKGAEQRSRVRNVPIFQAARTVAEDA